MSDKKQSSVEWLAKELLEKYHLKIDEYKEFKQAKAIEKQQIIDVWLSAWKGSMLNPLEDKYYEPEAEQYYNEKYGDKTP